MGVAGLSVFSRLKFFGALHPLGAANMLSSIQGKTLDQLYAILVHKLFPSGSFFSGGWGEINVDWLTERSQTVKWPPPEIKVNWKCIEKGTSQGAKYSILEGKFDSPCSSAVFGMLPQESRVGRVRLLAPEKPTETMACVLHLPGTGDHGFRRRLRLGYPLLKHGIASLILEGPFYGARRPDFQRGSKLRRVSDLFTLGRATIEESLSLLHWAEGKGFKPLGVSGLSMGGVHACMVASFYPGDLACCPILAPRSAAVAFCEGALQHGILDWGPLASSTDETNKNITDRLQRIAQVKESIASLKDLDKGGPFAETPFFASDVSRDLRQLLNKQFLDGDHFYPDDLESGGGDVLRIHDAIQRYEAKRRLQEVLEAFTDVTLYPRPKRPDAAVFVAAQDDAFASADSIRAVHKYWQGSEIRYISGGHVSAYVFRANCFSQAIKDSFGRLMAANPGPHVMPKS
ncbi:hypothetical protein BSKO_13309 [Bryopsis sp. KO-2023]|nr:hypothetical protein BSKO_13309 [Bryopsis sp. KO-2023]